MLSADLLFRKLSIRSHIPSQASLLRPLLTSLLTSVNSPPRASRLSHVCRSRRRSSSNGLTRSRLRLPLCPNLPHTIHRARLAHRRRSHHTRRASRLLIADSNTPSNSNNNNNNININNARNRTDTAHRLLVILTRTCLLLCLPRRRRPTHTTPKSNKH